MTTFVGPPAGSEAGIGSLTLGGLLDEVVDRHHHREALVFHHDGRVVRWTYEDLAAHARRVAAALLAAGVTKGTRVALLMGTRPEWVAGAFGVAMAGGVLVPLNTYFEPPELAYVLRHCDAAILLMQAGLAGHRYVDTILELCAGAAHATPGTLQDAAFPCLRRVVVVGLDRPTGALEPWPDFLARGDALPAALVDACRSSITPADEALVIYTSGTTARPKGVVHAHRAPALQSWRFAHQLRFDPTVRSWSTFPFFWSAGFAMVMGATLAAGGCLVLQEQFEPGEALRLLEAERVTSPHAWPHQLAQLEDHADWPTRDLSSMRHVEAFTSFGRHPSVRVGDEWSSRAAYGLTETFTIVSSLPADTPASEREGCQGRILAGNAVRIVDPDTGVALAAGAAGEIAVKGPTLMTGYAKTAREACFDADGFFHTGDAGFVDERGYLHFTGRASDLIKSAGANVSPVEVEEALLRHAQLKAAVVVGLPDPLMGEIVVVCAVAHDGAVVGEDDVRSFLRGRIAVYKIPRRVLFVSEEDLLLTANAKIRTQHVRALVQRRLGVSSS